MPVGTINVIATLCSTLGALMLVGSVFSWMLRKRREGYAPFPFAADLAVVHSPANVGGTDHDGE